MESQYIRVGIFAEMGMYAVEDGVRNLMGHYIREKQVNTAAAGTLLPDQCFDAWKYPKRSATFCGEKRHFAAAWHGGRYAICG